jgi:hypothetical protein
MRLPAFLQRPSNDDETLVWTDGDDRPTAELMRTYAAQSLSPSDETLSRMGATVRAAFVESQVNAGAGLTAGTVVGGSMAHRFLASRGKRRAFASICAVAILTLSTFGFAGAQSNPGQPFYRIRLNLENLPLPAKGDQLDTSLTRAEARLGEIGRGAAVKDWNAAADAAGAYRDVIAATTLPSDPAAKAAALQRLDEQLASLEQLRATSQGPETAALDRAIAALCALLGVPVPTPTPAATTASRGGGAGPTPTHRPDQRGPGSSDQHRPGPSSGRSEPTPFDPGGPGHSDGRRPRH